MCPPLCPKPSLHPSQLAPPLTRTSRSLRSRGSWFRCDDAWVTEASEQEVAQCQAYMLFFCQDGFYDAPLF